MADDEFAIGRRQLFTLVGIGVTATAGCTRSETPSESSEDPEFGYGGVPVEAELRGDPDPEDSNQPPEPGETEDDSRSGQSGGIPPGFGGGDEAEQTYGLVGYGEAGYGGVPAQN